MVKMIYKIYNYYLKEKDEYLAWGLALGLVLGLASGLFNLNNLIPINPLSITILIISIVIISEIIFWLNKERKCNHWFKKTLLRKVDSLFTSILIIINLLNIWWLITKADWNNYFPAIVKFLGYIGVAAIGLALLAGIIYGYILLNGMKYRK